MAPWFPLVLAFQAASGVKFAEALRITPDRPACLSAHAFPVIKARIDPWNTVRTARLHFRPETYALWYSVAMQRTRDGFMAVLPKPRPSARRVFLFVEAEGMNTRARSLEQSALVVEDPAQCSGDTSPAMETAAVTVSVPRGAPAVPPVPPGFEPVGAVGEQAAGGDRRDTVITAGALAAAGTAVALGATRAAERPSPPPAVNPELTVIGSVPPPESRLSLSRGAVLEVRVRLRMHQSVHPGQVSVVLYRAADGPTRPCGLLAVPHQGFLQGAVNEVLVAGPLQQGRTCEPSDRVRVVVTQLGSDFVATGSPGIPDAMLRYFVGP